MRFQAVHGVLPDERTGPQPFAVDVEVSLDLGPAGRADRLDLSVDYGWIHRETEAVMMGPRRDLLEALAEEIASRLLRPPAVRVRVRVKKLRPPLRDVAGFAAAEVVRGG
jgi:dihydroneopterin aldolase